MNCIKDALEIAYYIAFIILTWRIVLYAKSTYELESSRQYDLLCRLVIREDTIGGSIFGFSLEVYNAGNKVAKNVTVTQNGKQITVIDFVKPNSSSYYPLDRIMHMMTENIPAPDNSIAVEKGKALKLTLVVDGKASDYELNTDILFATRDINTGTLKEIEEKLAAIEKAINTEHQRRLHG